MKLKAMLAAAAALGLASAPVAAQAATADRAAAPAAGENALGGNGTAIGAIFAVLVFVAFLVTSASEDDEPVSA